ncbi:MAG: molybdenum cofactor guanylyltransferase, partial [Anaerolineales bacterium]
PDLVPGRGALGGLLTALSSAKHNLVAVIACDMPFASPDLLAFERDLLVTGGHAAVIPRSPGGTEPFHAVYNRDSCLPAVDEAIRMDRWRVDAWFNRVDIRFLSPEEVETIDPHRLAFRNVNTPEELADAERLAVQLGEHPQP